MLLKLFVFTVAVTIFVAVDLHLYYAWVAFVDGYYPLVAGNIAVAASITYLAIIADGPTLKNHIGEI